MTSRLFQLSTMMATSAGASRGAGRSGAAADERGDAPGAGAGGVTWGRRATDEAILVAGPPAGQRSAAVGTRAVAAFDRTLV